MKTVYELGDELGLERSELLPHGHFVAKLNALNDFAVFTTVALSSLSAGALQSRYGWQTVNMGLIPLLVIVLSTILWGKSRRGSAMTSS